LITAKRPPQAMTIDERTAWDQTVAQLDVPLHRAVAATLRYSGLLRVEVAALDLADVLDLDITPDLGTASNPVNTTDLIDATPSSIPRLRVAGDAAREVPIPERLQDTLRDWLKYRPRYATVPGRPALFISPLGNRISLQRINDVVWDVAAGSGLPHVRPNRPASDLRRRTARTGARRRPSRRTAGPSLIPRRTRIPVSEAMSTSQARDRVVTPL